MRSIPKDEESKESMLEILLGNDWHAAENINRRFDHHVSLFHNSTLNKKLIEKYKLIVAKNPHPSYHNSYDDPVETLYSLAETIKKDHRDLPTMEWLIRNITPHLNASEGGKKHNLEHWKANLDYSISKSYSHIKNRIGLERKDSMNTEIFDDGFNQLKFPIEGMFYLANVFNDLIEEMRKDGIENTEQIKRLTEISAQDIASANEHSKFAAHLLRIIHHPQGAVTDFLKDLPLWFRMEGDSSHSFSTDSSLKHIDLIKIINSDSTWKAIPGINTNEIEKLFSHFRDRKGYRFEPKFPTSLQSFYWDLMKDPNSRWKGVGGYISTIRVEESKKNQRFIDDSKPQFIERLKHLIPAIASQADFSKDIENIPLEHVVARLSQDSGSFELDKSDPYDLLLIAPVTKTYHQAVKDITKFIGKANIPSLDSIISEHDMNYNVYPLQWVSEEFSKEEYSFAHNDPILKKFAELSKDGFFRSSFRATYLESFLRILPKLQSLQGELSQQHIEGLIGDVVNLRTFDNDFSKFENYLDIMSNQRIWKKFLNNKEGADKRSLIFSLLTGKEYTFGRIAAQKEKSLEVLKAIDHHYNWKTVEKTIPSYKVFMQGMDFSPNQTYRVLKTMLVETDITSFIGGIIEEKLKSITPLRDSVKKDLTRVSQQTYSYATYYLLQEVCKKSKWRINKVFKKEIERLRNLEDKIYSIDAEISKHLNLSTTADELHSVQDLPSEIHVPHRGNHKRERIKDEDSLKYSVLFGRRDRLVEKMMQTVTNQINLTLELYREKGYQIGLEKITGRRITLKMLTPEVSHAVALYYTIGESEQEIQVKPYLKDIIEKRVKKKNSKFTSKSNDEYLKQIASLGINIEPWTKGYQADFNVKRESVIDIEQDIIRYQNNVYEILEASGIQEKDIPKGYILAKQKITDSAIISDLEVQIKYLESLDKKKVDVGPDADELNNIIIYMELDPLKAMMMGSVVNGSCLSIGGGCGYSAVINAIDENKRVIYAAKDGDIIGRKLISITQDNVIVQFETYRGSDLFLDEAFEQYIFQLSERMKIPLGAQGEIKELHTQKAWYNDRVKPFEYVVVNQ